MRTLVLNSGYEPILVVSWQKAICLVIASKAEVVSSHQQLIHTVKTCFERPSVVRLTKYVRSYRLYGKIPCTRRNVYLRDKKVCQYCGTFCPWEKATIDHVLPRSRGGKTNWSNVVLACAKCNNKKGNKLLGKSGFVLKKKPQRPQWSQLVSEKEGLNEMWVPYFVSSFR